jgi:multiple sugar transport system permease protein
MSQQTAVHVRAQAQAATWFLLPASVAYVSIVIAPVLVGIAISFTNFDFNYGVKFIGLANYARLLAEPRFWVCLKNTAVFAVFAVSANVSLGLLLAVLLNRSMPRAVSYFLRLSFFLPVILAASAAAVVWSYLYSNELGVINYYIRLVGWNPPRWTSSSDTAMISVLITDVWKNVGFFMIIFVAALQRIPKSIKEAALLDSTSAVREFFQITVPYISPVILFCVVFASIGALQAFESISLLTRGGPGDATRTLSIYITDEAFTALNFGYAAAVSVVLTLIIACVNIVQLTVSRTRNANS